MPSNSWRLSGAVCFTMASVVVSGKILFVTDWLAQCRWRMPMRKRLAM